MDKNISSDQFDEVYIILAPNTYTHSVVKFTFIEKTQDSIILQIMQILYSSIFVTSSIYGLPCPILFHNDNDMPSTDNNNDDENNNDDDDQDINMINID